MNNEPDYDNLYFERKKMTEYDVVSKCDFFEFIAAVNEKLQQGWKLQGGICTEHMTPYYQAIYREADNAD